MPFSHHSHSGQFCGHAADSLEEVVEAAIARGMTTYCLTEHIHRDREDFYPGEAEVHTPASLEKLYDDFYNAARALQRLHAPRIRLFVGFEGEWIRPSSLAIIDGLLQRYAVDVFVGSVHHVHTIPIDYDRAHYHRARDAAGGSDEMIFADYFDDQLEMLRAVKPPVVGHFDLIRQMADAPDASLRHWPAVWERIMRNLHYVAGYGGVLELNSSALRKGMSEAYPKVEICKEFVALGGRFTLSDDSHGTQQVGLNYHRVRACMEEAGIATLHVLAPVSEATLPLNDPRFAHVGWSAVAADDLDKHPFWSGGRGQNPA